jgi:hypothetical protein
LIMMKWECLVMKHYATNNSLQITDFSLIWKQHRLSHAHNDHHQNHNFIIKQCIWIRLLAMIDASTKCKFAPESFSHEKASIDETKSQ